MQTVKTVLRWIFGLGAMASGLMYFEKGAIVAGIIYLIAGVFVVPFSHNLIFEKLNINLNRVIRYVVALGLSALAYTTIPESVLKSMSEENAAKKALEETKELSELNAEKEKAKLEETESSVQEENETIERIKAAERSNPERYLELEYKGWNIGGFGTVGIHNFNIKNTSKFDLKDAVIKFTYFAESGTELSSDTKQVFKLFKAGSTTKVREFNAGLIPNQAASCNAEIITATVIE